MTSVHGHDDITPDLGLEAPLAAPEAPGIGTPVMDGLQHMGDMLIDMIDGLANKVTGTVMGVLGGGMAISGAGHSTGREENPGYQSGFVAAAVPAMAQAIKIEAPAMGKELGVEAPRISETAQAAVDQIRGWYHNAKDSLEKSSHALTTHHEVDEALALGNLPSQDHLPTRAPSRDQGMAISL